MRTYWAVAGLLVCATGGFVVQPDGTRTDCTPVSTLVDASSDDDGKGLGFCEKNETFAKHQGAPIKVQDRARIAYRLAGK